MNTDFVMHLDVAENVVPRDAIFIHGNLASNTWWAPAAEVLRRKSKGRNLSGRMILGEWRGSGQSGSQNPPPAKSTELHPSVLADDYIRTLRSLQATHVDVIAHSTGGLIALFALMQAPELFHRAVLLDPVGARGVQFEPAALEGFRQMSENRDVCAAVMNTTIQGNDPHSPLFQRIVDDAFGIAKMNWLGIPEVLRTIDITADLPKISHPVLVLHGEHDPILPIEPSRELAKSLPNGTFQLLKGQGHSMNVENPVEFVRIFEEFVGP